MTQQIDQEARQLFKRLRSQLVNKQPFFGVLALQLKPRQTTALPTLATDGRSLFYNPDFLKKLHNKKGMTVTLTALTHEIMHCAFSHMTRRGNRDAERWNKAGDYVINNILQKSSSGQINFELDSDWLFDSKYDGMSTDEVYRLLAQEEQKQNGGDGDGEGGGDDDGHNHGKCSCGGVLEPKDSNGNPVSSSERKKIERRMQGNLAQAAMVAKMQGKVPAGMDRYIDDLLGHKADWKALLRQFIEQIAKNDFNWARRSRRSSAMPYYLPSLHSVECGELVVAIDTSGSISMRELQQFGSELSGMLETAKPEKVHVIYVDTEVSSSQEFTADDLPIKFSPTGGGGTLFSPAFAWVEEQGIDPKALIYMTDMCCNDFGPEPEYPVLWVTFEENATPFGEPPFGEVIQMELDD